MSNHLSKPLKPVHRPIAYTVVGPNPLKATTPIYSCRIIKSWHFGRGLTVFCPLKILLFIPKEQKPLIEEEDVDSEKKSSSAPGMGKSCAWGTRQIQYLFYGMFFTICAL